MHRSPAVIIVQNVTEQCTECGAACQRCSKSHNLNLQQELEQLRSQLEKCNERITQMDDDFSSAQRSLEAENLRLLDELAKLQDKQDRLHDSYVKLQKLNHTLESRLLTTVENYELEKKLLNDNVASLDSRLLDAQIIICDLQEDLLPDDVQYRVRRSLDLSDVVTGSSKAVCVPLQRTAVVYSVADPTALTATQSRLVESSSSTLTVSGSAMAKVLGKPAVKPRPGRLVICAECQRGVCVLDRATQTHHSPTATVTTTATSPVNGCLSPTAALSHTAADKSVETRI